MVKIGNFSRSVAALLKARECGNKPFGDPGGMTYNHLEKFNIMPDNRLGFLLRLKPGHAERAAMTSILGKERFWSSVNFHSHLEELQSLVPNVTEESARTWIDPFFFRVSAMVLSNQKMVLGVEQVIHQTAKHPSTGYIDYTAVIADDYQAETFWQCQAHLDKMPSGFFVAVPKMESNILMQHVPQAVREMYACAQSLERGTLRGALSNGSEWIFIIIVLNPDGKGAKYRHSSPILFHKCPPSKMSLQIAKPWPDVLAGILFHWIKNSYVDIGSDDWFENLKRLE